MSKIKDWHPRQNNKNLLHTHKDQRRDLFITNENRSKKSSPRMGWSRVSGTVKILILHLPFITWRSKEGKVDWWIKSQKLHEFKEKDNNSVLFWYYTQKKENLLFIQNILMPTISSHINLFRISNINQTWFRTCQDRLRYNFKNRDWITVSNKNKTITTHHWQEW